MLYIFLFKFLENFQELECKLREQRKKLKDYKERLRAERDLRIVNERSMMEEVEKYKRELKREQRERKATEQRYLDIITNTKTRLTVSFCIFWWFKPFLKNTMRKLWSQRVMSRDVWGEKGLGVIVLGMCSHYSNNKSFILKVLPNFFSLMYFVNRKGRRSKLIRARSDWGRIRFL